MPTWHKFILFFGFGIFFACLAENSAFGQDALPDTAPTFGETRGNITLRMWALERRSQKAQKSLDRLEKTLEQWQSFRESLDAVSSSLDRAISRYRSLDVERFKKMISEMIGALEMFSKDPIDTKMRRLDSLVKELQENAEDIYFDFPVRTINFIYSQEKIVSDSGRRRQLRLSLGDRLRQLDDFPSEVIKELTGILEGRDRENESNRAILERDWKDCDSLLDDLAPADRGSVDTLEKRTNKVQELRTCLNKLAPSIAAIIQIYESYEPATRSISKRFASFVSGKKSERDKKKAEQDVIEKEITQFQQRILNKELVKEGAVIDLSARSVIVYTLGAWVTIIVLFIIAIIFLNRYAIQRWKITGTRIKHLDDFSYLLFLEMMTVFLLTGTILILGIANKIDEQGLTALIGGISGYVLGRIRAAHEKSGT